MMRLESEDLLALAARVARLAIQSGTTLCAAESCTGGLVSHMLTTVPGVSAVFQGGVVSYSNLAKSELLGVPEAMLESVGAVSEPVARAMARGACERLHARLGVSTTGVAGPGGGSAEKPVGLVYVAIWGTAIDECRRFQFGGDRTQNVLEATHAALGLLESALITKMD